MLQPAKPLDADVHVPVTSNSRPWHIDGPEPEHGSGASNPLADAVELLAKDRPVDADRVVTAALLTAPGEADLWLAAGIARLRRGAVRSASAALRMCMWISDEPLAQELLAAISVKSTRR